MFAVLLMLCFSEGFALFPRKSMVSQGGKILPFLGVFIVFFFAQKKKEDTL